MDEGQTPLAWLWAELERRYGAEVVEELRQGYNQRQRAEEERPWIQIRLVPGESKWVSILPFTVSKAFSRGMFQPDGENWLLSLPPGYVLAEWEERLLESLVSKHILKSWQVLPQEEH